MFFACDWRMFATPSEVASRLRQEPNSGGADVFVTSGPREEQDMGRRLLYKWLRQRPDTREPAG